MKKLILLIIALFVINGSSIKQQKLIKTKQIIYKEYNLKTKNIIYKHNIKDSVIQNFINKIKNFEGFRKYPHKNNIEGDNGTYIGYGFNINYIKNCKDSITVLQADSILNDKLIFLSNFAKKTFPNIKNIYQQYAIAGLMFQFGHGNKNIIDTNSQFYKEISNNNIKDSTWLNLGYPERREIELKLFKKYE